MIRLTIDEYQKLLDRIKTQESLLDHMRESQRDLSLAYSTLQGKAEKLDAENKVLTVKLDRAETGRATALGNLVTIKRELMTIKAGRETVARILNAY